MARLPIALFCLLQGRYVTGQLPASGAVAPTLDPIYPDVADGSCTAGSYCTTGVGITTPPLRGLCVASAAGQQCWDACNTNHSLNSYYPNTATPADVAEQKAIAMMVAQLRAGSRYSSCPGNSAEFAAKMNECAVGERCTPPGLTRMRGMCVSVTDPTTQVPANSCLDMCDTSIPIETYKAPGKQAGTVATVQAVQNGRDPSGLTTCPGITVWVWLWFPLALCCLIGCCAGAYGLYNMTRPLKQTSNRGSHRDRGQYDGQEQAFVQDQAPPMADYQDQEMPPPQTMEQMPQMDDAGPMPVLEPQAQQYVAEPSVAPLVEAGTYQGNIFDQPSLMAGLAPLTVAAPTSAYPYAGSNYLTSGAQVTTYPAAQSMSVGAPVYMPAYGGSTVQTMTTLAPTRASATVTPTYGAYGAYGTAYPGTTSMRIG